MCDCAAVLTAMPAGPETLFVQGAALYSRSRAAEARATFEELTRTRASSDPSSDAPIPTRST